MIIDENNPFVCRHTNSYPTENGEKCVYCGAIYDDAMMDWVTLESEEDNGCY